MRTPSNSTSKSGFATYAKVVLIGIFLGGSSLTGWASSQAFGAYIPYDPVPIDPNEFDAPDNIVLPPDFVIPKKPERQKDSRLFGGLGQTLDDIESLLDDDPNADLSVLTVQSWRHITEDGDIQVYVRVDDFKKHLDRKLEAFGLDIQLTSERMSVIQGWASYEDIPGLSRVPGVSKIGLPLYAYLNQETVTPGTVDLSAWSEISVIPEPMSAVVLIAGGLMGLRLRRKK